MIGDLETRSVWLRLLAEPKGYLPPVRRVNRLEDVFGIGPARRPGSLSPSEVAQGFGLIAADSAGEAAGVVNEVACEEKIGGNAVEGTFNKDMTVDGMVYEAHKQIVKP